MQLLIWDEVCGALVGNNAIDILDSINSEVASKARDPFLKGKAVMKPPFTSEFDALLGKELLFKIHIQEQNISGGDNIYVVKATSDDPALISKCKQTDHAVNPIGDDNEEGEMAIMADDDSVSGNKLTPPAKTPLKRRLYVGSDGSEDDDGDASLGQSTTKVRRVIKQERRMTMNKCRCDDNEQL